MSPYYIQFETDTSVNLQSVYPFGYKFKKQETKKEKKQRIAKEKMLASWDLHNKNQMNVKQVIQICKPRHNNFSFRKK